MSERGAIAVVDVGTISSRLLILDFDHSGRPIVHARAALVTDLGEGNPAECSLEHTAVERTLSAVRAYAERIRVTHFLGTRISGVVTTLTSAARDADDTAELLEGLASFGLAPQIISGGIEARATFLGAAGEFPGERVTVADIGGGSTEVVTGSFDPDSGSLTMDSLHSYEVGALRLANTMDDVDGAYDQASLEAGRVWAAGRFADPGIPHVGKNERLVTVGGTVTSLVAIRDAIDPYDPDRVHGSQLKKTDVAEALALLAPLTLFEREQVVGLQAARANTIVPGALIAETIMTLAGAKHMTVSESDILVGMARNAAAILAGEEAPLGWHPEFSTL